MAQTKNRFGGVSDVQEIQNGAVLTGVTVTKDVDVTGYRTLTIIASLLATITPADLSGVGIKAYRADGTTITLLSLPAKASVAAASDGTNVNQLLTVDVTGFVKIRVQATNSNAGTLNMILTAYMGA